MNKTIAILLLSSLILSSDYGYHGSTTAAVTLVGATIKAKHENNEKKYPRKNCPVCKGAGKYLSGDGIKMVDCGYCEPEKKSIEENEVVHPPVVLNPGCKTKVIKK
jgi:hypothetical protein